MAAADPAPRRDQEPDGALEAVRRRAARERPRPRGLAHLLLLSFVQLEFAGQIGLPEGRYLARDGEHERVLIVQTLFAARPAKRGRRRVRPVEPAEPENVPVTRLTLSGAELADKAAGRAWLEDACGSAERRGEEVRSAMVMVNRAIGALRAEARDPLVQELGATKALAVRLGFGSGDDLAEGRWVEARELPPRRRGRLDDVESQSRVAAVLAGRDEVHPAETLLLRARLDADQGRLREARYGLRAAVAALEGHPIPNEKEIREQLRSLEQKLEET